MNVLVIGSGGREHAMVKKIVESPLADRVCALPGNAGMTEAALLKGDPMNPGSVIAACKENAVDFCVVAPDDPLASGLVDCLEEAGVRCFGPVRRAARLEASKLYAKELMDKYHIPTARWRAFTESEKAAEYLKTCLAPIVVKADGLAKGKGVVVARTIEEAERAARDMLDNGVFGSSGATVIIEECLEGREVSVMTLVDGEKVVPLLSAMDHKRALDGDKGANTGGMGVIAPSPFYTEDIADTCMRDIFLPTARAMVKEGTPFSGCIFFGLMLTKDGPKVLEYNARFGDPETQCVMSLFTGDLLAAMLAVREGKDIAPHVSFKQGHACTVVAASEGYPGTYETGKLISVEPAFSGLMHIAGAKKENGRLLTAGGRVLSVTMTGGTLREARYLAYEQLKLVHFDNMYYRGDIGAGALLEA